MTESVCKRRPKPAVICRGPDGGGFRRWSSVIGAPIEERAGGEIAPQLPFRDVELDLEREDGVLKLTPLRFGVAGGTVDSGS